MGTQVGWPVGEIIEEDIYFYFTLFEIDLREEGRGKGKKDGDYTSRTQFYCLLKWQKSIA